MRTRPTALLRARRTWPVGSVNVNKVVIRTRSVQRELLTQRSLGHYVKVHLVFAYKSEIVQDRCTETK